MTAILEFAEFAQHHRVAEVDIRRRRIDAELDAQRPALPELALELALRQAVDGVASQPGGRF